MQPATAPQTDDRRARVNALRLAVAQALAGANATVVFATAAIIGSTLAADPALATAPVSVFVVGMAAGTLPTGWLARRFGRRTAFMTGSFFGFMAGLIAAAALPSSSTGSITTYRRTTDRTPCTAAPPVSGARSGRWSGPTLPRSRCRI